MSSNEGYNEDRHNSRIVCYSYKKVVITGVHQANTHTAPAYISHRVSVTGSNTCSPSSTTRKEGIIVKEKDNTNESCGMQKYFIYIIVRAMMMMINFDRRANLQVFLKQINQFIQLGGNILSAFFSNRSAVGSSTSSAAAAAAAAS